MQEPMYAGVQGHAETRATLVRLDRPPTPKVNLKTRSKRKNCNATLTGHSVNTALRLHYLPAADIKAGIVNLDDDISKAPTELLTARLELPRATRLSCTSAVA